MRVHLAVRKFLPAVTAAAIVLAGACATDPETGGHSVVFSSVKGEQDQAKREHLEIIQFYGLYEDQAVQDYVQSVGAKVAAQTPIANWNFKFFVLDDDEVNAFTPGGGYVYIHRGLMNYLNTDSNQAEIKKNSSKIVDAVVAFLSQIRKDAAAIKRTVH